MSRALFPGVVSGETVNHSTYASPPSWPRAEGIDPVSRFSSRHTAVRFVSTPRLVGIVPSSKLSVRMSTDSAVQARMASGMDPDSWLDVRSRTSSAVSALTAAGMLPRRLLHKFNALLVKLQ